MRSPRPYSGSAAPEPASCSAWLCQSMAASPHTEPSASPRTLQRQFLGPRMRSLIATATSLVLLASAPFHADEAAGQAQKSQTITRTGPSAKGSAEYFTGNVRVDPLFPAN